MPRSSIFRQFPPLPIHHASTPPPPLHRNHQPRTPLLPIPDPSPRWIPPTQVPTPPANTEPSVLTNLHSYYSGTHHRRPHNRRPQRHHHRRPRIPRDIQKQHRRSPRHHIVRHNHHHGRRRRQTAISDPAGRRGYANGASDESSKSKFSVTVAAGRGVFFWWVRKAESNFFCHMCIAN